MVPTNQTNIIISSRITVGNNGEEFIVFATVCRGLREVFSTDKITLMGDERKQYERYVQKAVREAELWASLSFLGPIS